MAKVNGGGESLICGACDGTGEGYSAHLRCSTCGGSGEVPDEAAQADLDDAYQAHIEWQLDREDA